MIVVSTMASSVTSASTSVRRGCWGIELWFHWIALARSWSPITSASSVVFVIVLDRLGVRRVANGQQGCKEQHSLENNNIM